MKFFTRERLRNTHACDMFLIPQFAPARRWLLSSCLVTLFISGCSTVGLGNVSQTRSNYNKALDASENEQFLLNVVRLHYGESPYFVGVDSITAATSLTSGVNGDFGINNPWAPINGVQWSVSPQIAFSQTPTVTYSPIRGAKFATGMLAPLSLDKVYLLLQSGYNVKEVMKLSLNRVGKLDNGVGASHLAANKLPDSRPFDKFIDDLGNLAETNQIRLELSEYQGAPAIFLYASSLDAATTLSRDLQLSQPYYKLIIATVPLIDQSQPESVISVYPRSFFNVINFLSKNVDDGNKLIASAALNVNATLANSELPWDQFTHNMLHVYQSSSEPVLAVTKVEYEGNWYYIAENDYLSKSTLILMKLIYSLQISEVRTNLPLITIPINN